LTVWIGGVYLCYLHSLGWPAHLFCFGHRRSRYHLRISYNIVSVCCLTTVLRIILPRMNVDFSYGTGYGWAHSDSFFWAERLIIVLEIVCLRIVSSNCRICSMVVLVLLCLFSQNLVVWRIPCIGLAWLFSCVHQSVLFLSSSATSCAFFAVQVCGRFSMLFNFLLRYLAWAETCRSNKRYFNCMF
jgi:hypothetical protein